MNDLDRARDALAHIDAGIARDAWVRIGMAAKSAGLSFDDFHNWSATGGNYVSENDCRTVWKSFKDGSVTASTLYGMALAEGWQDPAKSRPRTGNASSPRPSINPAKQTQHRPAKPAVDVDAIWARCIQSDKADSYIDHKQGKPDGVRIYPASAPPLVIKGQDMTGALVVPCWDGDKLQTLQFIALASSEKLNLPGASFGDGFFVVGDIASAKKIFIVEGIGQAWATVKADPASAAVVCFGVGRMARVAKVLRDKYPAPNADPARICAQVVNGMGFLGSATVFKSNNYVKGINTAANLWISAAVSMAVGAGMWEMALVTSLFTAMVLSLNNCYKRRMYEWMQANRDEEAALEAEDGKGGARSPRGGYVDLENLTGHKDSLATVERDKVGSQTRNRSDGGFLEMAKLTNIVKDLVLAQNEANTTEDRHEKFDNHEKSV